MRTQDYLKQASDSIKQATISCLADLDQIRQTVANRSQEMSTHLNELKRRESTRLNEAAAVDGDRETASRLQEARMLRNEESQVQKDFDRQKRLLDERAVVLQRIIDELNQNASQLDRQISQVDSPQGLL